MTKEVQPTIKTSASTVQDPWGDLKQFTRARIALGRVGISLPTKEILSFGMSHAMARDAVHLALDTDILQSQIESLGVEVLKLHSRAPDRASYLLRPDWGRRLSDESTEIIKALPQEKIDVSIVIGDGLSSLAVQKHAAPMLQAIQQTMPSEWKLGPVVIASQARVALADEVGELMYARMVILLIGERPGLSSPDSLGLYLTYQPKVGCSDADRNCISNVRPEGLNYEAAAKKLMWLAQESMRLKVSGVELKDESDVHQIDKDAQQLLT
jgi:ethanolamine ammonia-lyase small subunit